MTNIVWINLSVVMANYSSEKNVMMVTQLMVMAVTLNVKLRGILFVKAALAEIPVNFVEMEFLNFYFLKAVTMETKTMEMVAQALANQNQVLHAIINFSHLFVQSVVMDNKILEKHVMMPTL